MIIIILSISDIDNIKQIDDKKIFYIIFIYLGISSDCTSNLQITSTRSGFIHNSCPFDHDRHLSPTLKAGLHY